MQRPSDPPHTTGFSLHFSRSPYRHQVYHSASRGDIAPFGLEAPTDGFNMRPLSRPRVHTSSCSASAPRLRCVRNAYTVGTSSMVSFDVDSRRPKTSSAIDRTMQRKNDVLQSANARHTMRLRNATSVIDTGLHSHVHQSSSLLPRHDHHSVILQESRKSVVPEEPPFVVKLAPSWRNPSCSEASREPPLKHDPATNTHTFHQHLTISNPVVPSFAAATRTSDDEVVLRIPASRQTEDERLLALHR